MRRAQRLASSAVGEVLSGHSLSAVLPPLFAREDLPAGERALVQELAFGTLRHLGFLRAAVAAMAGRSPAPAVAALLWVSLYQLVHTRAPEHAVVDEAGRACRLLGRHEAVGFVNALLRRFLRERDEVAAAAARSPEGRWSHPRWWIDRLVRQYPAHWESILAAGNSRPPLTLRVNRAAGERSAYLRTLEAAGIAARPIGEHGVVVAAPVPASALPGFAQGQVSVQDHGAQLAAPLLDVAGCRVLDACAAPGGKTTHLLECGAAEVLALDSDASRLPRIEENLARLRLCAEVRAGDARQPGGWWDGQPFDRILVDAPCTASGVARRHPDVKWLRRESDLAGFAGQQSAILDAVWPLLRPGGRLLYVTCSVFAEENEAQAAAFLERHADAQRVEVALPPSPGRLGAQLLPGEWATEHNHDGFFHALLRKR